MRHWLFTGLAVAAWATIGLSPKAAAQEGDAEVPRARIGVATFEGDDSGTDDLPVVSSMLAGFLASSPVHVTPPDLMGEMPAGGADAMASWARAAGTEVFLTGQVLRFGERLSIHTRLRSSEDGRVLETFVEEVPRNEGRLEGIGALGSRILAGVERALGVSLVGDANGATRRAVGENAKAESQESLRVGGDDPIEIQSEEIEVIPQRGGGRRIVFTTDVNAVQGPMRLRSDRLEAIYPPESEGPARYVASGNVRMDEDRGGPNDDRQMLCDQAVFYQEEERLVCTGSAELREGNDLVKGNEIEILFARDVVKVRGGAFLNLGAAQ